MEIIRLIKANIKHKKGSFKSIAALMAIIVLSFTGTVSNNDNIDRTLDEAHIWSGTADMTAFIPAHEADEEFLETVSEYPDVTDVKTEKCVLAQNKYLSGQDMYQTAYIYSEDYPVYRVFNDSETGYIDSPEPLKEGEIYIAYTLKSLYDNVDIGSEIKFEIPSADDPMVNNTYSFTVKGFIADPHFGGAVLGTKRFFVCGEDLEKLYNEAGQFFRISEADITLTEGADYLKVKKALDESCGLADKSNLVISDIETIDYTKLYSDTGSGVVFAFVILLIIITIITMYHSITTAVDMEYVNLGVLKALGFTSRKIRTVYILQYIIAEVIGAVTGLVLSVPVLYLLGNVFQTITGLATIHRVSFLKCGMLSAAVIAVCVIFVIIATSDVAKISPVRAISGGKSEVHFDSRLNVPVKAKPLSLFLGLRQFTSRGKSYAGVVLIAALLVYFMISIVVLSDRLSGGKIVTGLIYPDITAALSDEFTVSDMKKIEDAVYEVDKDAKVFFDQIDYIMAEDIELLCEGVTPHDVLYQPLQGRMPLYANEAAVTEIVAEQLGKKIGDTIMLGSGKKAKEFIITGYYQSVSELGKTFTVTMEGFMELSDNKPVCMIELSDESLAEEVSAAMDEIPGELIGTKMIEEQDSSTDGMIELIDSVCVILVSVVFVISVVFAAVVINMICSKTFVRESIDIGILKSLGFTADDLRIQFSFRFMIISAIGSVIGGVISVFLTSPLLELLMRIVGLTQIEPEFTPMTFIVPCAVICASFFVFAYIAAAKVKNVQIRELISE